VKLYLNELAPWERKNEYLQHIQLGKDVKSQTSILHNAISDNTNAQLASANAIIASQERIAEGIGDLSVGIDLIGQGIEGLQSTFEWGISEVVWQIEQNRQILRDILQILSAPLDTQALELRKRAEEAYANGWIDDALQDFLESEMKNRYDFSIHISLGMIYLFHKPDKKRALTYFEKAIKYAKPKSNYHTSYALLHKGLIMRDIGKFDEAEKCTAEAIKLYPNFAEAYYQNAQYNAQLRNVEKTIHSLLAAVKHDKNYCLKADIDKMFDLIRPSVNQLFKNLRDANYKKSKKILFQIEERIKNLTSIISEFHSIAPKYIKDNHDINSWKKVNLKLKDQILFLLKRNSYFDSLDTIELAKTLMNNVNNHIKDVIEKLKNLRSDLNNSRDVSINKSDAAERSVKGVFKNIFTLIAVVSGLGSCAVTAGSVAVEYPTGFMVPFTGCGVGIIVFFAIKGLSKLLFEREINVGKMPMEARKYNERAEEIGRFIDRLERV